MFGIDQIEGDFGHGYQGGWWARDVSRARDGSRLDLSQNGTLLLPLELRRSELQRGRGEVMRKLGLLACRHVTFVHGIGGTFGGHGGRERTASLMTER